MTVSRGVWGPCVTCGQRIHRYGPGGKARCPACEPGIVQQLACHRCGGTDRPRRYLNGLRLCASCGPTQDVAPVPSTRQRAVEAVSRPAAARCRVWLPAGLGSPRPEPIGGQRPIPRDCSRCKQPTTWTTPRGRSVHPTCEGWLDRLDELALIDLVWSLREQLPIVDVIEEGP